MTSLSTDRTFQVVETDVHAATAQSDAADEVVNIAIVVDAEGILDTYRGRNSSPDAPITLNPAGDHLLMAARRKNTTSPWDAELTITVPRGSVVRWRESTMSFNTRYRAQLYKYEANDNRRILSDIIAFTLPVDLPLPNQDDPLDPSVYAGHDYFWQATAVAPGTVTYHWDFMILDDDNDKLGYYRWDPFVTVT